jgi:hypothetical protein
MILVVRLLDHRGIYLPRTRCVGSVEIRNRQADTPVERDAISVSCGAFGDEFNDLSMRIATLVDAPSNPDADNLSEERFEEVLDALASETHGISQLQLLGAGCFVDLQSGAITPRVPRPGHVPTTTFHIIRERFRPIDWPQYLLSSQQNELSRRLIRSYHWSRKAHLEGNRQLRVLFRWFAMEAIWMVGRDDDIVPRVMWSLGFPNGAGAAVLSRAFVKRLAEHDTIRAWKAQLDDRLKAVRSFRNDSVHSGFRPQDVARAKLAEFDEVALLACSRVQNCAKAGVLAGLSTAADLLEYLPLLVEADLNYVNDVHRTILYGLEHAIL